MYYSSNSLCILDIYTLNPINKKIHDISTKNIYGTGVALSA